MSSAAMPFDTVPTFIQPQKYILVWPGDEPLSLMSIGESLVVPGRDEVAKPGSGSVYRWPSAPDEHGIPIPGTLLIEDVRRYDPETTGDVLVFDATEWVKMLHSNRENNGVFKRGFSVVRNAAEARKNLVEFRGKYEKMMDVWAENEIRTELGRLDYWAKKGQPAPMSTSEESVRRAHKHLELRRSQNKPAFSKEQLAAVLGSAPAAPVEVAPLVEEKGAVPAGLEEKPFGSDDPAVYAQILLDDCEAKGIELTPAEYKGLLRHDETVMASVYERTQTGA